MKPTLTLVLACIAAACSPLSKVPEKKCLDLRNLKIGDVRFEVNKPRYDNYKRNYLVQIYADTARKTLIDNVLLSRKTEWTQTIHNVKKEYCIVIFKDRTLTTYAQMEWDTLKPAGSAMIDDVRKSYYASAKRGALLLPITSKDGSAGDGVRAVVN